MFQHFSSFFIIAPGRAPLNPSSVRRVRHVSSRVSFFASVTSVSQALTPRPTLAGQQRRTCPPLNTLRRRSSGPRPRPSASAAFHPQRWSVLQGPGELALAPMPAARFYKQFVTANRASTAHRTSSTRAAMPSEGSRCTRQAHRANSRDQETAQSAPRARLDGLRAAQLVSP